MMTRVIQRAWADLPLRIKGLAVIAVSLVPVLVLASLVTASVNRERAAQAEIVRTLEVQGAISALFGLMADAETGVRGYLLSRNADSLKVVYDTAKPLQAAYVRLRDLVQDDAVQVEYLRQVNDLARNRPLDALLDYAKTSPATVPPPPHLLEQSRATMRQLRSVLGSMHEREAVLFAERAAIARAAQDRLRGITIGSVTLGGLAAVVAAFALTHGVARRVDALRANANRLARGEALTPLPAARDEVGQLGRALQDAATLLKQRDQELTQFFSLSLDLLCIASLDGRFTRVNGAWQRVLGWTPEQLVSVPFIDFVHPDDVAATIAETAALGDGRASVDFENRYRCSDGRYRWLSWKATADPAQGTIYAAARDVTEQKRAAIELAARNAELAELNQELEAFSYSVSHDLRSPLRHISGFATLLEERERSTADEQSRRYLDTIRGAATRMGRLIDDLLAFSRVGRTQLTKRRVDLTSVVNEAQRELQTEAQGREIAWIVHPLPHVVGDPALLRLVFVNLLSNAIKYTRTRGRAEIEVGTQPGDRGEAIVFVRDNGVGFEMQYAHKLFGVFQRLHRAEEFDGTGIGLANVRRIVHRHGGRAWAEAAVDQGATFFLSLPAAEGVEADESVA